MSVWLFLFGIGLMGAIISHGFTQQRQIAKTPALNQKGVKSVPQAPDVREHHSSPRGDRYHHGINQGQSDATLHALTARQPWLLKCVAPTLTWADLYAMLDKAHALYDPHTGIFHIYDSSQERLLYSVSKADTEGALPTPYHGDGLRGVCSPILLMLPLDEGRNAHYDALLALSTFACELIDLGGAVRPTSQPVGNTFCLADFESMLARLRANGEPCPAGRLLRAA